MDATISNSNKELFKEIINFLEGSFDNFQQAWQENTEEAIHRVEVEQKHRHIHTKFQKQDLNRDNRNTTNFTLKHYENRNKNKIISQHTLKFYTDNENDLIYSLFTPLINQEEVSNKDYNNEKIFWKKEKETIIGKTENSSTTITIKGDILRIFQQVGFFANPLPYRMIKCRFFSGFIEIPDPHHPDTMLRMGNLELHDQGDRVQFTYKDGKKGKFIVELTQLIFAKRLAIMKLGIYNEPLEQIHYSSRAISYTWTNPDAKRIGINIRKILTGWTLIEPGFISSNNMDLEKET